jgi:hypothetical protein
MEKRMKVKLTQGRLFWGSFSRAGVGAMRFVTNECFEVRRAKAL